MNHISLFIIIASLLFLDPVFVSDIRRKRVLLGLEGLEQNRDHYDSFRYYVFISRYEPNWVLHKLKIDLSPSLDSLVCGGSLLTPFIVQTAAHCFSKPGRPERTEKGYNLSYFHLNNVWENPLYSFVGANLLPNMAYWLRPKYFVIHDQTRRIVNTAIPVMNDFGIIVTEERIHDRAPNAPISYVPAYSAQTITDFYAKATEKEYTCLHIGHGLWNVVYDEQQRPKAERQPSVPIRWGWRTLMNEWDCETVTYTPQLRRQFEYEYITDATWACSQSAQHDTVLHDVLYVPRQGDSGGPVTCNNVYLGIIMGSSNLGLEDKIAFYGPITHTLIENAADFREVFYNQHAGIAQQRKLKVRALFHESMSQSPPQTLPHYILLLATTNTFFTLLLRCFHPMF